MSYKKLLTHRCDVYRLEAQNSATPTYGVDASFIVKNKEHNLVPVSVDVPCLFIEKSQTVVQGDPAQALLQRFLVHFLPNADILMNDKVVWDGEEFILQKPRKIRNHHQEVTAVRKVRL
ncbi:DUF3599 family protein [Domibacillus iocasae]|uniref:DUF3599 domain-containing protein n=1 Tax=Domibacillus iocasae TaxID=1714016 RepID=A0A1E7DRV4_9BACI|nr:DUF3599 family protein [Domibacillus iocasae]OES45814.1 hypothetical protein BA724_03140 [Domibacillus iocasae]